MSTSVLVFLIILIALGYFAAPVALIWGWVRWVRRPKLKTIPSMLSLIGFSLATASALLAISSVAYAAVVGFRFYDPSLLRIIRWGYALSIVGIFFGISGVWRPSSLRWHAPVCALGTLALWIFAAEGE